MSPAMSLSIGTLEWSVSSVALATSLVWVVGQLVVMVMAWARRRHCNPLRRWGVIGLNVWVTAAGVLLIAPLQQPDPLAESVTLITEGSVEVPAGDIRYRLGSFSLPTEDDVPQLKTPGQIPLRHPTARQLQLTGHGLSADDWATLPEYLTIQWSPPTLQGLTDLHWPSHIAVGEPLRVSGRLRWDGNSSPLSLSLVDLSGRSVDTQTVLPGEGFYLEALPPVLGPVEYTLEVAMADARLASEPVSSFVRTTEPPRLMIWQSAPSFDTQQLTRWAADSGAQLLVRTQISRDRYLSQRINVDSQIEPILVPSLLATIDMIVLDGRQWVALESAERATLMAAVEEGLGLLVLIDSTLAQAMAEVPASRRVFGVVLGAQASADERLPFRYGGQHRQRQPIGPTPLPVAAGSMTLIDAQPFTVDEQGAVLEAWRPQGLGRIALSRLRDRYRWATSGADSAFSSYWSNVLATIARPSATPHLQPLTTPTALRPFKRLQICADNPQQEALSVTLAPLGSSSPTVPLMAPVSGGSTACGFVWTADTGWHWLTLKDAEGSTVERLSVRVLADDEHQTDRFARRQRATSSFMKHALSASAERIDEPPFVPINPWWTWGALLLGLAPLWLERRLLLGRQSDADVG